MEFSSEQNKVIQLNRGKHACLASAGAGKTEVLTQRISDAISSCDYKPEEIACITFTNQAALNMKNRVEATLGEKAKGIAICNTHTIGIQLLNKHKYFPKNFTLADESTDKQIWALAVASALGLLNYDMSPVAEYMLKRNEEQYEKSKLSFLNKAYNYFSLLNLDLAEMSHQGLKQALNTVCDHLNGNCNPYETLDFNLLYSLVRPLSKSGLTSDFKQFTNDRITFLISEKTHGNTTNVAAAMFIACLVGCYFDYLKNSLSVYNFDDILLGMLDLPNQGYKFVQVDEAQDLSPLQWLIINNVIVGEDANFLSFGDMSQSIYRFLGASIETTADKIGQNIHELSKNYRSPANLLEFFNAYTDCHFPPRYSQTVTAAKPASDNALLHINRGYENDQLDAMVSLGKDLASEHGNIAYLLPTNNEVDNMSSMLDYAGIQHFRVSSNDLLQSKNAQDFITFLRCFCNKNDTLAWSRLLWNFGRSEGGVTKSGIELKPQLFALYLNVELARNGLLLSDLIGAINPFEHYLKRFYNAVNDGYSYFDTETDGLKYNESNIIQIACVKGGKHSDKLELDAYCLSNKPVGDSEKIHHISDATLQELGKPFAEQVNQLIEFCGNDALMAHNMQFDEQMTVGNILRQGGDINGFGKIDKFCTLEIARRIFPDLESYKLASLLETFNLEGVNSHNALDDTRAGANLADYISTQLKPTLEKIDGVIDLHQATLTRFIDRISGLFDKLNALDYSGETVELETIFDLYFEHVADVKAYSLKTDNLEELRSKLVNWSREHFKPTTLRQYLGRIHKSILTLKESDLITSDDQFIVSTIHRSKGLQFDTVFMPNVTSNKVPSYPVKKIKDPAEKAAAMDEQKRLLYVGMTRAKERLVIGTFNQAYYGAGPSNFIKPILGMMKEI